MENQTKSIVSIYTESTPNPQTMKFVVNRMFTSGFMADITSKEEAKNSALAIKLFDLPFTKGVFFKNNFVALTKNEDKEWIEIIPETKELIREFLNSETAIFDESYVAKLKEKADDGTEPDGDLEKQIVDVLQTYVQPAVEMDGGSIVFKNYENGVVTVGMQGACSGCPSSTLTLKQGIEGLLKRMVPQVEEVVAENM